MQRHVDHGPRRREIKDGSTGSFLKSEAESSQGPVVSLPSNYPSKVKTCVHIKTHTRAHTTWYSKLTYSDKKQDSGSLWQAGQRRGLQRGAGISGENSCGLFLFFFLTWFCRYLQRYTELTKPIKLYTLNGFYSLCLNYSAIKLLRKKYTNRKSEWMNEWWILK